MPNKTLDTLVADIYALLDENTDHTPSEENIEWLGESVKAIIKQRLSSREREAATLRFSSLGKKDRQLWYAKHKPEEAERMEPKTYFKFLYGDMIELLLLFFAKEAGHEVSHEQEEVEVDGVKGHIDAIIDGVVVDVKSASPFSYKKFMSGGLADDDPFGYIQQISGYSNVLTPGKGAAFLVADKVHGDIGLCKIGSALVEDNPPGERIAHLKEVLDSSDEPERCYEDIPEGKSGNRKLGLNCSYCAFAQYCWRDANDGKGLRTFLYANGPVFLTKVEREPNVPEAKTKRR